MAIGLEGTSVQRREVGKAQPPGVRVRAPKPKASRGREGASPPAEGDQLDPLRGSIKDSRGVAA